jgi:hypothetical protein
MIVDFPNWSAARDRQPLGPSKPRRNMTGRQRRRNRLAFEMLEPRLVLSTVNWNTVTAPTDGDWDVGNNWVGGIPPSASDIADITGLTGAGTGY